jgi:hypothetical protein
VTPRDILLRRPPPAMDIYALDLFLDGPELPEPFICLIEVAEHVVRDLPIRRSLFKTIRMHDADPHRVRALYLFQCGISRDAQNYVGIFHLQYNPA